MQTPLKVIKEERSNPTSPSANGNLISSPLVLSPTIDTSAGMLADDFVPGAPEIQVGLTSNKSSSTSLDSDNIALHRVDSKQGKKVQRGKGGRGSGGGGGYITKRSADRITVEGSPLVKAMGRKSSLSTSISEACASSSTAPAPPVLPAFSAAAPNKKTNHNSTPAAFKQAAMFSPSRPPPMAAMDFAAPAPSPPKAAEVHVESVVPAVPVVVTAPAVPAAVSSVQASATRPDFRTVPKGQAQQVLVISAVPGDEAFGHNTGMVEHSALIVGCT
jgi:hypothetical protein